MELRLLNKRSRDAGLAEALLILIERNESIRNDLYPLGNDPNGSRPSTNTSKPVETQTLAVAAAMVEDLIQKILAIKLLSFAFFSIAVKL